MKKLVLLVSFFSLVTLSLNAKIDQKSKVMKESGGGPCWEIANRIEAVHCGYVGCDFDWWLYSFDSCMAVMK